MRDSCILCTYVFRGIFRPACGLCNILLILVTLNLPKAHTHTNTQADVQIKHGHVRQRTHTNAQDFRTSWQSWGPKTQSYPMAQAQTPREWDVKARGEFYVVDDMQQHVGDARTHTHTYTFKNMLLGTPCRLGWTESFAAILCACTPLISTVSAYLQHTHTHTHIQSICISLTLAVFQ